MDIKLKNLQTNEQLYQYLESNKNNIDDVLKSSDLKTIIDAVDYTVQNATRSTKDFLLQKRFNIFYSYYPFFFQHVPNHAVVEVSAGHSNKFIDLELAEEFVLNREGDKFRFQAAIPFSVQPFQVTNTHINKNMLSVEISAFRSFKFDRNRFLLSANSMTMRNYQIYHLVKELKKYKSAKMTLFSEQLAKPITKQVFLNFDIVSSIDVTQETILKSLTQAFFSNFYIEFDSLPEEHLFNKIILEIELPITSVISKVLANDCLRTNLLPVINVFDDYAMKINCDYTKESYAIKHIDDPNMYVPTKLHTVGYNKEIAIHSYVNFGQTKSYDLIFEASGHIRIVFQDPDVIDIANKNNEVIVNAQWTQIYSADVERKSYTFMPLSRSLGNLRFNIVYNYGFKRNQLLERADNILKILNVIDMVGLKDEVFYSLVSLITNNDSYVINFIKNNLVCIEMVSYYEYVFLIKTELSKFEFIFYVELVYMFLLTHLSNQLSSKINLQVKVK